MEDIIEHHGVKGQKWGVRRKYKGLRNEASDTDLEISDLKKSKTGQEAYNTHLAKKAKNASLKNQYLKDKGSSKLRTKLSNRSVEKANKKLKKNSDKLDQINSDLSERKAHYSNLVKEARSLKVKTIPQPKREKTKLAFGLALAKIADNNASKDSFIPSNEYQKVAYEAIDEQIRKNKFDDTVAGR